MCWVESTDPLAELICSLLLTHMHNLRPLGLLSQALLAWPHTRLHNVASSCVVEVVVKPQVAGKLVEVGHILVGLGLEKWNEVGLVAVAAWRRCEVGFGRVVEEEMVGIYRREQGNY